MSFTDEDRNLLYSISGALRHMRCQEHERRLSNVEGKGSAVVWLLGFIVATGGILLAWRFGG